MVSVSVPRLAAAAAALARADGVAAMALIVYLVCLLYVTPRYVRSPLKNRPRLSGLCLLIQLESAHRATFLLDVFVPYGPDRQLAVVPDVHRVI